MFEKERCSFAERQIRDVSRARVIYRFRRHISLHLILHQAAFINEIVTKKNICRLGNLRVTGNLRIDSIIFSALLIATLKK